LNHGPTRTSTEGARGRFDTKTTKDPKSTKARRPNDLFVVFVSLAALVLKWGGAGAPDA
jgi:hypothetical protein